MTANPSKTLRPQPSQNISTRDRPSRIFPDMGTTTKTKHVLKQRRESSYYMYDPEIRVLKPLKTVLRVSFRGGRQTTGEPVKTFFTGFPQGTPGSSLAFGKPGGRGAWSHAGQGPDRGRPGQPGNAAQGLGWLAWGVPGPAQISPRGSGHAQGPEPRGDAWAAVSRTPQTNWPQALGRAEYLF